MAAREPTNPGGSVTSGALSPELGRRVLEPQWPNTSQPGDSSRHSPAQVAVHGLHVVVLAARERAQLVEGHSCGETEVTQSEGTLLTAATTTQHC